MNDTLTTLIVGTRVLRVRGAYGTRVGGIEPGKIGTVREILPHLSSVMVHWDGMPGAALYGYRFDDERLAVAA
jgi:hypothetical protein